MSRHLTKEDIQMVNKHIKMCSTSHAIRELQITMRHHWIPIATAKIQKPCYTKCWKGCGARGTLILWWECEIVQPL